MVKGANVGLATLSEDVGSVMVSLGWSSATGEGDADVSVLLLDGDGKVRSDVDFCFYNNPVAGDGSVQLLGKTPTADGSEDRISFDLDAVPQEIEKVVVAASRYAGSRFGELEDLRLTLADSAGDGLVRFAVEGADEVSAVIFGELYRRSGEWKFRAVGQGYASGLAGLATDYGVDIDDDAEQEEPEREGPAREGPEQEGPEREGPEREGPEQKGPGQDAPETPARVPAQARGAGPGDPADPVAPAAPAAPRAAAEPEPADPAPGPKPARRPRTAKKKVTLPRTAKKSLADNDTWRTARLFPVSALKSDRERETRATSVVLSVMAQVPEFGRRLTAGFGAPAGRMETFTEVTLPHGESPRRPDGVVRVERAGKLWTALVETKTNGNALKPDQVQAYMDIAARRGYEAVITLSNDVALEGSPLVDVRIDRRRKHKVALWHLSWAEVVHQAQMLIRHEGVGNAAHAWLLQELLQYLQHENSGCHGFQNMGAAWVPVRRGIDDETLCRGDARALEVIENWERLVRQVCLRLGGELGQKVLPVQRARRGSDPSARRSELADHLCEEGRLGAEIRIEGTPGVLAISADLRTGKLRTSIEVPAAEPGYPLSRAKRLVRRLSEAPADLHIETLVDGEGAGPRGTLERLRPEPADILPRDGAQITGFRLSLFKGMGNGRGSAETGFIRSVDEAVDRFHAQVVAHLEASAP
ncbi:TerD family protein [Streptomyces sp. CA-278952]|uniref:TerD family protein n=1 Tax=Streptomyces sp. CA-278952 TaxID=2980556 RepID=UPI0023689960|nr:TerD family protein [Streptomyces sp. CA-278952]WDG33643.1 TerD family protein [Streptomyces sp. CA-278952]